MALLDSGNELIYDIDVLQFTQGEAVGEIED